MNDRGKLIKLIVLVMAVFAVIYISIAWPTAENKEIWENGTNGIGIVRNVGFKTVDIGYTVNDKSYVYTKALPYSGIVPGEQFRIKIKNRDERVILIFFAQPVIDIEKYDFDTTYSDNVSYSRLSESFSFSYSVNGKDYEKYQNKGIDVIPDLPKKCPVVYRIDRPDIGYVLDPKTGKTP